MPYGKGAVPVRRIRVLIMTLAICACGLGVFSVKAEAQEDLEQILLQYEDYQERFNAIETAGDVSEQGFYIIEDQSFPVVLESFGEEEVTFLPIMDRSYRRMALLITDSTGNVLYKTNQLETNNCYLGEMKQPTRDLAAVSFQDVNRDGQTDIILITDCVNDVGDYAGKTYKVGDVLFQREGGFYRDWRVSDKINRFSMNKSIDMIVSYVRDGHSTEVLYTAATLDELVKQGFRVIQEQNYYRTFEKQGRLQVVPGIIRMADYDIFMIYLVNEQGYIVWSFQPMGDYDNLYALKGMACRDMDGDGMKDILVLGRFSYSGPDGEIAIDTRCCIYYQRTDGFETDTEFEKTYQCTEEDTVEGLTQLIREYWGWTVEE